MKLLLLVLVLVLFCGEGSWTAPAYCYGECPEYKVVQTWDVFEERCYRATKWITTNVGQDCSNEAFMAAHLRLKGVAGTNNFWPVLINVTAGAGVSLWWFLPSDKPQPKITDPLVTLQTRPQINVYVRSFDGTPGIESGKVNKEKLCEDLHKAGKTCTESVTYSGAGYDSYFSFTHHNEIWIDKTQ